MKYKNKNGRVAAIHATEQKNPNTEEYHKKTKKSSVSLVEYVVKWRGRNWMRRDRVKTRHYQLARYAFSFAQKLLATNRYSLVRVESRRVGPWSVASGAFDPIGGAAE